MFVMCEATVSEREHKIEPVNEALLNGEKTLIKIRKSSSFTDNFIEPSIPLFSCSGLPKSYHLDCFSEISRF